MKKIIDGKRYDTETADDIADWGNGLGCTDFRNINESLYRTKNGAWFLAGSGGAMTRYSVSNGNMSSGGSDIIVLTDDEARRWLEDHDYNDTLETYFSDQISDA